MKGLVCIPLSNRAVLKSVAASSIVPAHSQVGPGTGPAEKEPSKKWCFGWSNTWSGSQCSHMCLCGPTFPSRNEDVFGEVTLVSTVAYSVNAA